MLWQQLLKRLLALDCTSYEGFSTSGNTFVTVTGTCKLKGQRSFIAYCSIDLSSMKNISFVMIMAVLL